MICRGMCGLVPHDRDGERRGERLFKRQWYPPSGDFRNRLDAADIGAPTVGIRPYIYGRALLDRPQLN